MKLLQLLAKELREWPEADCEQGPIESMSQAGDMQVSHYSGVRQVWREDVHDWSGHDYVPCSRFTLPELATDHATAIVTRADWEAEKARIAGKVDGGWKRNRGRSGKCPVPAGQPTRVKCRDGAIFIRNMPERFDWKHQGTDADIMQYCLHKPDEQPAPVSEEAIQVGIDDADAGKLTPIAEVKARWQGKPVGPLEWRSRIAEIDKAHASLGSERKALIERLASVGLAIAPMA